MPLAFPHEIHPLNDKDNQELMSLFRGERSGFVRVGPKGYLMPAAYREQAQGYYNIQPRPDDLWVITYPRTGTTVTQELVWLLNNNLDYEKSGSEPLHPKRFPFLEFSILHHPSMHAQVLKENSSHPEISSIEEDLRQLRQPGYQFVPSMPSPRHIKSHLPFSLLPPSLVDIAKVVYVARNPKDVVVSYYHHNKLVKVHDYVGDFEKYWELFENDKLVDSPFVEHVMEAWNLRHKPNLYFLFYEDLVQNPCETIKKLAKFLGKQITEDEVKELADHIHINNFREKMKLLRSTEAVKCLSNPTAQGFIRRGKVGGNKEWTEELNKKADKWIEAKLSGTDLKFPC